MQSPRFGADRDGISYKITAHKAPPPATESVGIRGVGGTTALGPRRSPRRTSPRDAHAKNDDRLVHTARRRADERPGSRSWADAVTELGCRVAQLVSTAEAKQRGLADREAESQALQRHRVQEEAARGALDVATGTEAVNPLRRAAMELRAKAAKLTGSSGYNYHAPESATDHILPPLPEGALSKRAQRLARRKRRDEQHYYAYIQAHGMPPPTPDRHVAPGKEPAGPASGVGMPTAGVAFVASTMRFKPTQPMPQPLRAAAHAAVERVEAVLPQLLLARHEVLRAHDDVASPAAALGRSLFAARDAGMPPSERGFHDSLEKAFLEHIKTSDAAVAESAKAGHQAADIVAYLQNLKEILTSFLAADAAATGLACHLLQSAARHHQPNASHVGGATVGSGHDAGPPEDGQHNGGAVAPPGDPAPAYLRAQKAPVLAAGRRRRAPPYNLMAAIAASDHGYHEGLTVVDQCRRAARTVRGSVHATHRALAAALQQKVKDNQRLQQTLRSQAATVTAQMHAITVTLEGSPTAQQATVAAKAPREHRGEPVGCLMPAPAATRMVTGLEADRLELLATLRAIEAALTAKAALESLDASLLAQLQQGGSGGADPSPNTATVPNQNKKGSVETTKKKNTAAASQAPVEIASSRSAATSSRRHEASGGAGHQHQHRYPPNEHTDYSSDGGSQRSSRRSHGHGHGGDSSSRGRGAEQSKGQQTTDVEELLSGRGGVAASSTRSARISKGALPTQVPAPAPTTMVKIPHPPPR